MAVRDYDIDPERNVLNTKDPDEKIGFVIKTDEQKRKIMRSSRYESVEFTDTSLSYGDPFEDEVLLSGQVEPQVAAVYDTGYDGKPNIYDPSKDHTSSIPQSDFFDRTLEMGALTKESFATPAFFQNPVDLLIGCIVFGLVIILEIIGLIILF
ncbi:MAG: hypothetical protein IJ757_02810 [Clostridiales bacterium]|nr:hypothetical protein [Clostridiales bacterium]